ncbi:TerC family protein [Bacillus niameyensis]|uniref:TerC family protein n=1 Tax=Bacillus niameyensis TaxID=1522308 RepID=UPI000782116B|nr:hypothetical protein [Bacillus niameyensis]
MQGFLSVFFITFISDIDNLLILGAILRKHSYLRIAFPAVVMLTLTRTLYIILINGFSYLPMIQLLMGMILLYIAFKFATRPVMLDEIRPNYSLWARLKVLFLIVGTDFLISMDSVIIISGISETRLYLILGIFSSLLISFFFLPFIIKLAINFSWITIIAGGFIAKSAVTSILNDPVLVDCIVYIESIYPRVNIFNKMSSGVALIVVVIGVTRYHNSQYIKTHKR